ncbi:hypothetical protein HZY97_14635 [Sphingomonas sp. R-74633]|uniref:hypothetical protein n=1 Tax=Sphingomonas sp. R-74633 TaxID=2751188 RepID=UPI0015D120E9|nr:hypothetical protein [Sphingomonas sp. R-74633]NYT42004.1 hypothetical protein [Sphingomonas sp. R-74633]
MNAGRLRTVWLGGIAAATLVAPTAHAQDVPAPSPTPAPIIVPRAPAQQQLPGVIPERFSIAPTPSPTPAPVPSPTPTASAAVPVPQRQVPAARPAPVPREATPVSATPTPAQTPAPSPAAVLLATPTPLASASPQPVATVAPVSQPEAATPPWLWAAAGAGGTALLGLGGWLLFNRRRREEDAEEEVFEAEPVAASPPPPVRVQPPPGLSPVAPAAPVPAPVPINGDPFELVLNPHRVIYAEKEVLLEFELLVGNATGAPAENIRIAFAAMSAHAQQDAVIAGFHGGPPGEPGGAPFDLAPGAGGRMPVRLAIPHSGIQVVQVGGRPMFVPIVLIDLRWRGGLSVRRFGMDFMLGTVGQGDKLGPLWLDRPAPTGPLAAHRYFARQVAAA